MAKLNGFMEIVGNLAHNAGQAVKDRFGQAFSDGGVLLTDEDSLIEGPSIKTQKARQEAFAEEVMTGLGLPAGQEYTIEQVHAAARALEQRIDDLAPNGPFDRFHPIVPANDTAMAQLHCAIFESTRRDDPQACYEAIRQVVQAHVGAHADGHDLKLQTVTKRLAEHFPPDPDVEHTVVTNEWTSRFEPEKAERAAMQATRREPTYEELEQRDQQRFDRGSLELPREMAIQIGNALTDLTPSSEEKFWDGYADTAVYVFGHDTGLSRAPKEISVWINVPEAEADELALRAAHFLEKSGATVTVSPGVADEYGDGTLRSDIVFTVPYNARTVSVAYEMRAAAFEMNTAIEEGPTRWAEAELARRTPSAEATQHL